MPEVHVSIEIDGLARGVPPYVGERGLHVRRPLADPFGHGVDLRKPPEAGDAQLVAARS